MVENISTTSELLGSEMSSNMKTMGHGLSVSREPHIDRIQAAISQSETSLIHVPLRKGMEYTRRSSIPIRTTSFGFKNTERPLHKDNEPTFQTTLRDDPIFEMDDFD